jgi:hypothetical protein
MLKHNRGQNHRIGNQDGGGDEKHPEVPLEEGHQDGLLVHAHLSQGYSRKYSVEDLFE